MTQSDRTSCLADAAPVREGRHPATFAPATLILIVLLSVFGAVIGVQLIVQLGVTPNTSIIGALVAMILARVPLALFTRYRSIHVQNLAQSAISAATFGAANSLLLPIGVGELSPGMLVAFVVYAAFAAFVHELIVGISAMHAGWFPAFAVALITLIIGILLGFPPVALALLVGFSASTGPAFADMGYDLRAGYLLRGEGTNPAFE